MKKLILTLGVLLTLALPAQAAIAVDATGGPAFANNTSVTWNHTTAGSDRIMIVYHMLPNSAGDTSTGCTYNSVAMTLIQKQAPGGSGLGYSYLYYLVAPATGTNSVVCSTSGTTTQEGGSTTYTGASQTGQPDSFSSNSSAGTETFTLTTTVVASNSWLVGVCGSNGGNITAGSGTTLRTGAPVGFQVRGVDSNGVVGTGSQSLACVNSGDPSTEWGGVIASIKEVGGGGGGGGGAPKNLPLIGVGD